MLPDRRWIFFIAVSQIFTPSTKTFTLIDDANPNSHTQIHSVYTDTKTSNQALENRYSIALFYFLSLICVIKFRVLYTFASTLRSINPIQRRKCIVSVYMCLTYINLKYTNPSCWNSMSFFLLSINIQYYFLAIYYF